MAVDHRTAHAGAPGDGIHADPADAVGIDDLQHEIQQLFAPLFGREPRGVGTVAPCRGLGHLETLPLVAIAP